jgi:hypothetical protein
VVAFDVVSRTFTDVRARYFTADGGPPTAGALAADVALDDGMGVQQYASIAPVATPPGFVGAWESGTGSARNVVAEAFENRAPPTSMDARYVSVPVAAAATLRQQPSVAVAGNRALVVWREGTDASAVLRAVTYEVGLPLSAPSAPVQITPVSVGRPRAVALRDGGFAVVWSATGDIFARKVSSAGALAGEAVLISPISAQIQDQPAAAALEDGIAVAWHDEASDAMGSPTVRWARTGANLQRVGDAHGRLDANEVHLRRVGVGLDARTLGDHRLDARLDVLKCHGRRPREGLDLLRVDPSGLGLELVVRGLGAGRVVDRPLGEQLPRIC